MFQELMIYICIKVSRDTYNSRGMQLNDGPHGAWAGACRTSSGLYLSVCLFVGDYSRTTGYEVAYERYQEFQCYKGKKTNAAISLKRLRSRDVA